MSRPAHRLAAKPRTSDVHVSEDVTFAGLLLSEPVLLGLRRAGFERPSPIQLRAIPLGRCAVDLIVQAKSGTGKTCVLAVLALEVLVSAPPSGRCRALVIAPTREVAVQVAQVITAIGAEVPGLAVHTLIGGLPLAQDVANLRRCNIAVGTPGRVRQLVDSEALNTDSVRLFVMDEADKLMEDAFIDDINFIYSTLPASKQMVALSATYPESLANLLARYMRSPTFVRLGKSSGALLGIRQYVLTVPHEPLVTKQLKLKLDALVNILSTVSFTQCLVFSNHQTRAETLCSQLSSRGWPSAHLSSSLPQEVRLEALAQLTSLRCRVLVTTDLGARGVDSEHADLVVQLDVPWDGATYLHRVGRAGRYGSLGAAVALVSVGEEERRLTTVLDAAGISPLHLPDTLPADLKTCATDGWRPFAPARNGTEKNGHSAEGEGGKAARTAGGRGDNGKRGVGRSNGHTASVAASAAGKIDRDRTDGVSGEDGDASGGGGGGGGLEGRKIRVARRRGAPGPSAAEQRQDSAQLEAASDGWARAVGTRGRRQTAAPAPAPAVAGGTPPAVMDWDRPPAGGKGSSRTAAARAASGADSDSDDSQDSFKALLEAYKRDQDRQVSRCSAGGEKATAKGGRKAEASANGGRKAETSANGGRKAETSANGGRKAETSANGGRKAETSANGGRKAEASASGGREAQQNGGVETRECETLHGSEPKGSGPVVVKKEAAVKGNVDLKPDSGGDQKSDGDSDVEAGSVDNDRLRQVLTKLNPKQVVSLTEDDLRTLVVYLKARRGADCRTYRQAVSLVRRKGVYQVLLQSRCAADIETSLTSMMERLSVEPEVPAARCTASSADAASSAAASGEAGYPSQKTEVRPSRLVNKRVAKSSKADVVSVRPSLDDGEAEVRSSDVDVTTAVPAVPVNVTGRALRSAGRVAASAATYTVPSMNGAAICTTSAIHATTNYDEKVRQIPSREEDVEAFQLSLRTKASRLKAARARVIAAAAVVDSSSSEDSGDESPSEEATPTTRGGHSGGRQRRAVPPRPASSRFIAQSSEAANTSRLPAYSAAVHGESHAPEPGGATAMSEGPAGSWAGYQPQEQHGYQNQMDVPSWSQQYPGFSGGYHASYHQMRPASLGDYDSSAYPSQPGMYGGVPPWSSSHWGQSGQSGWSGQPGQSGQPYVRPDSRSAQHGRSWNELLHTCYNQQTQYLDHMSRFYASYCRQHQS